MQLIKLMLVDDHAVLRDGLRNILEMEDDLKVIGEAETGEEALQKIVELQPDLIIMDINLPNRNGVEVTGIIKKRFPDIKILILTMHNHDEFFMSAVREGADGYLLKDTPSDQVVEAVRTVAKGESVIHPSMTRKLLTLHHQKESDQEDNSLTEREKEVLLCLVEGMSNKEIANKLFISDKTVKVHVSKIFKKLNAKSRTQVVIHAIQKQLVPILPGL